MVFYGLDDIKEPNLGRQRASMVDDWITIRTIPAVHYRQGRSDGYSGDVEMEG